MGIIKKLLKHQFDYKNNVLLFILLVILGIKYVYNIGDFVDIQLYDESNYLYQGIYLAYLGLPAAQSAPIYSFWYYLLSFLVQDSINIYFLNIQIVTIVLPVLLFTVLRRYKIPIITSFLVAYFFLLSSGNILISLKVSHFALILIFISLFISSFLKNSYYKFSIIVIGSLLSSYVRPELFISFIIFLLAYFYKIIKNNSFNSEIRSTSALGISVILIILIFGIPLADDGRSFVAFSQHYSLNWVKWNNSQLSPWTNADEIINKSFGKVGNIYEAMISNSDLFFKHIFANINSFKENFNNLFNHTAFSPNSSKFQNIELLILLFFTSLYALYNIYIKKINIINYFKDNLKLRREIILICIGYSIPVILSAIIVYPEPHYLIILLLMLIILIMVLLHYPINENNNRNSILKYSSFIIVSILLFVITPHFTSFYNSYFQNNIVTIRYLRSLNIKTKVNILEADGGYNIYLGLNYVRVPEFSKDSRFTEFLHQKNINMIIVNRKLTSYNKFNSDSTWDNFINNYEAYNFSKEMIPNTDNVLYLKNNLR